MRVDSLHILGSRQQGGADRFFVRLVNNLNAEGHKAVAVTRPGAPVNRLLGANVKRIHVPMRNGWDLFSLLAIRRLVAGLQPKIVQTYMGRATRLTRLPRKTHAVHIARLGGYYKIRGYYEHADAWVINASGLREHLVMSGLPEERIFLIGNFVEEAHPIARQKRFALRKELGLPAHAWLVFALARCIQIKGIDVFLQGLAQLPQTILGRPVHGVIAGDGPLLRELQQLGARMGLNDRLHWCGWVEDPRPYYQSADLFVCPSRRETLGNVILEAWAHGLPVVASRTPGACELIQHGRDGFLTPIGDASALARGILGLLDCPEKRRESMGAAGKRKVEACFSKKTVLRAYLDLYARLSKNRP